MKRALALCDSGRPAEGVTVLTYHRVGGGTTDELDLPADAFAAQVGVLARHRVVPLDEAADLLMARAPAATGPGAVVITFDDGFADMYDHAWPRLAENRLPFTLYLATAFVGGRLRWEGSTARSEPAAALTWDQIGEMVESGLCTIANHTHRHVVPDRLTESELDACDDEIERRLGVRPRHFAYPWGVRVPGREAALRARYRTAATGQIGRNRPGADLVRLRRVPVRRTDPLPFFRAKVSGRLVPERMYAAIVSTAKRVGARG